MIAELQDLKPGIYDVPRAVYESWRAINFSTLKHFSRTPAHAKYEIAFPSEPSSAQDMGDAFHACILEPERFATDYIGAPKIDRRSKEGKLSWEAFESENSGKIILPAGDYADCVAMRDAIWNSDTVAKSMLAAPGRNELSAVWVDRETDLLCKLRVDRLAKWNAWSCVIDAKSTQSASRDDFARSCAKFFYHVQAAYYLDGLAALADTNRRWFWIAVEKYPPFLFAVYEPTDRLLEQGRKTYREWLRQYKEATTTGLWPGYSNGIEELDLPRWAQEEIQ